MPLLEVALADAFAADMAAAGFAGEALGSAALAEGAGSAMAADVAGLSGLGYGAAGIGGDALAAELAGAGLGYGAGLGGISDLAAAQGAAGTVGSVPIIPSEAAAWDAATAGPYGGEVAGGVSPEAAAWDTATAGQYGGPADITPNSVWDSVTQTWKNIPGWGKFALGMTALNALSPRPQLQSMQPYTGGNLQYFKYDPRTYQPVVATPPTPYTPQYRRYAAGGGVQGDTAMAQGQMPGAMDMQSMEPVVRMAGGGLWSLNDGQGIGQLAAMFGLPSSQPTGTWRDQYAYNPDTHTYRQLAQGGSTKTDNMGAIDSYAAQYSSDPAAVIAKARAGDYNAMIALNKILGTPNQNYASGGISSLGGYSDGGRMLKGPGDGMSDSIPATISGKQPARLADGEFVVPADVVSGLGNGSTDAGAKQLYKMLDKVRQARTGTKKQGREINPNKYTPA